VVICNLECCISERGAPTDLIPGKPFFFRAPPAAVGSLRALGVAAVGLANNHVLDFGPDALEDTLDHLGRTGIAVAGAGADLAAARAGAVIERGGARVGLLALSDDPRVYAGDCERPGMAWSDLESGTDGWLPAELADLRERCDHLVVFPHWGANMVVRPATWQRARARDFVGAGADLVAGHSAHLFGGAERLDGALVLYDLGDALDDYAIDPRLRNDLGLLAIWRPRADPRLELVGLRLEYAHTRLATGEDADWIANRLARACGELGTSVERTGEQRFALVEGTA
jgi:poly-gamma-glutamate synthesis protein (capsule biosynthesis protein)